MRIHALLLTAALSSGCSICPPQVPPPTALMVECPQTLPVLRDGTAGEVALTLTEWAAYYHDCRVLHSGLVRALAPQDR